MIFVVALMDFQSKKLDYVIKSGAIVSTLGVVMLILFGSILLISSRQITPLQKL